MQNINDLFNQRNGILESMGYFNPLIIEENNVVVTEGVFGGIVEKIKALGRMIKGWLEKLIDFFANKFGRGTRSSSDTKEISSKEEKDIEKKVEEIEKSKEKTDEKIEKIDRNLRVVYQYYDSFKHEIVNITYSDEMHNRYNLDIHTRSRELKEELNKAYKEIIKASKELSETPKNIQEEKKAIKEYKQKIKNIENTKIKVPDLKELDVTIYNILGECNYAAHQEDPNEYFKNLGRPVKDFFLNSNREIIIGYIEFKKKYNSYIDMSGKKYTDMLKKQVKDIEEIYKNLENEASRIEDENEANKLLNRAKNINKFLQTTMTQFVKCIEYYTNKIDKICREYAFDHINARRNLMESENKLEELEKATTEQMKILKEKSASIKKWKNELRSYYGA